MLLLSPGTVTAAPCPEGLCGLLVGQGVHWHTGHQPKGQKRARNSAKVLSLLSAFQPRLNLPKGRAPLSSLHKLCPTSQMSQAKTGGRGHLKYCDICIPRAKCLNGHLSGALSSCFRKSKAGGCHCLGSAEGGQPSPCAWDLGHVPGHRSSRAKAGTDPSALGGWSS